MPYQYSEVYGGERAEGGCPLHRNVPQNHPDPEPKQRPHQTSAPVGSAPIETETGVTEHVL